MNKGSWELSLRGVVLASWTARVIAGSWREEIESLFSREWPKISEEPTTVCKLRVSRSPRESA